MINVREFKDAESYENYRKALEDLGRGLATALNALDAEYLILTPEEQKTAESLQNALTALSAKDSNQLPDETVGQHLKTIENNLGFFALQFGDQKETVLHRSGLSPERISGIEESLGTRFAPTLRNQYQELRDRLNSIIKNVNFADLEQERKVVLAKLAFHALFADPEMTGENGYGAMDYLSNGELCKLDGFESAAYALASVRDFWNERVEYKGRTKKVSDIFLETAANEVEKKRLGQLIDFSKKDIDGRILNYTSEHNKEYVENIPEDLRERFENEDVEAALERYEEKKPLFTGVPAKEGKSAYDHIDDLKASVRQTVREKGNALTAEDIEENIAKIMAARMLVNAERNKPVTLQGTVTDRQINDLADKIRNSNTFEHFISRLNDSSADLKKTAKLAMSGHGGEMESFFKEFVKNQPAGAFDAEAVMDRYNPTALERIEVLQDQIGKHQRAKYAKENKAAIAEIIAIRNAVNAERKNKESLNVKITAPKLFADTYRRLNLDDDIERSMDPPADYWKLARKGHGGQLLDTLRKGYDTFVSNHKQQDDADPDNLADEAVNSACTRGILESNTIGGRLNDLRIQAALLKKRYETQDKAKGLTTDEYIRKNVTEPQKKILQEYIALNQALRTKENVFVPDRLKQNIPWTKVNQYMAQLETDETAEKLTDGLYTRTMNKVMDDLVKKSPEEFFMDNANIIREQQDAQKTGKKTGTVQQKKEEGTLDEDLLNLG